MDLALNNQQRVICHKTQTANKPINPFQIAILFLLFWITSLEYTFLGYFFGLKLIFTNSFFQSRLVLNFVFLHSSVSSPLAHLLGN